MNMICFQFQKLINGKSFNKPDKKVHMWPTIVLFVLTFIIAVMAYIDWNKGFNIEFFDNLITKMDEITISDVPFLSNILGNFTAFGKWDSLGLGFVLLLGSFILAAVDKMSLSKFINNFGNGMKKMTGMVVVFVLVSSIFIASYYFQWTQTLVNLLIGNRRFNVFTLFIAGIVTLLLCVDYDFSGYILGNLMASIFIDELVSSVLILRMSFATTRKERLVIDGRIESDFGVTSFPSFVMKMMLAPPVSSRYVCVAGSRYIFSA